MKNSRPEGSGACYSTHLVAVVMEVCDVVSSPSPPRLLKHTKKKTVALAEGIFAFFLCLLVLPMPTSPLLFPPYLPALHVICFSPSPNTNTMHSFIHSCPVNISPPSIPPFLVLITPTNSHQLAHFLIVGNIMVSVRSASGGCNPILFDTTGK